MADELSSVRRKLERADKHLKDLGDALIAFQKAKADAVVREDDPETPDYSRWVIPDVSVDEIIPLLLGDAVHNLRSALDHLIGGAIRANGNTPGDLTCFFVPRKPKPLRKEYESTLKGKVDGVSDPVLKALSGLEPYQGGKEERLWLLDKLDIIDKHRLLLVVGIRLGEPSIGLNAGASLRRRATEAGWTDEIPDLWYGLTAADREPLEDGHPVFGALKTAFTEPDEQPQFLFDITLNEPGVIASQSILPTMSNLRQAVEEIIDLIAKLL